MKTFKSFLAWLLPVALLLCASQNFPLLAAPTSTRLAANGKPLQPIVMSSTASDETKAAAATLAEYLGRISGAKFEIENGDGKSGIVVGTASDFPALKLQNEFDDDDPTRREEYLLRSTPGGVLLIGATKLAVEDAVWDFLYRLGYRQFFPGAHWEIVPSTPNLDIAVDNKEKPDYYARRIWFTYGTWPENQKRMSEWSAKNRTVSSIALNTGHAYPGIINANKAAFAGHPEYFDPLNGERKVPQTPKEIQSVKFDISNPGLRRLVVDYALRSFVENPDADSISMDPSDGGNWGDSPEEQKLGSISDRVTLLANEVADAVNQKFPGKYVGFYAYNYHSPPPSIRVHPHVVVSVATAFISGGFTVDQLIDGWQKQGATIGMREYYSIIHWDKDLPNKARAGRPEYMARTIPHFYEKGARFMSAESSDNWGPNGLGYYLASRILWDVNEAKNVPALIEDFLDKSFGPAKEPMREYYGLINGIGNATPRPLSEDYIGRLYRALQKAYAKTDDAAIRARLDDLALYAHYLELYLEYSSSKGEARQAAYENLIKFAYRIRDTHMLHSLAIYRTGLRDKSVKIPAEASWKVPEKDKKGNPLNPWKQSTPFTPDEVQTLVSDGIAYNKLLDFEPKSFSEDLIPATALNLAPVQATDYGNLRGVQDFYVWAKQPGPIQVWGSAGFQYQTRGAAQVQFFREEDAGAQDEAEGDDEKEEDAAPVAAVALAQAEIPPDLQEHELTFNAPAAGLYRVRVSDRMMGSRLRFPAATPVAVKSALGATPAFVSRWKLYFYVPKGTESVGGFAYGSGRVYDGDGKSIFDFPAKDGYFSIPVPAGQDGRLWSFAAANGQIGLMTVPPYLARSEKDLLLPREVLTNVTQRR
jgi:hypothetical protein